MGDRTLLAMGVGVAQGFENASANLFKVMLARDKLKQEREAFDLDKKVKEAQINKLTVIDPAAAEDLSKLYKARTNAIEVGSDIAQKKVDEVYKQASFKRRYAHDQLMGFQTAITNGTLNNIEPGSTVNYGPGMSIHRGTAGGDQVITDATGKVVGYRPRGAVFQPKSAGFTPVFDEGKGAPASAPATVNTNAIGGGMNPTGIKIPFGVPAAGAETDPLVDPKNKAFVEKGRAAGYTDEELSSHLRGN